MTIIYLHHLALDHPFLSTHSAQGLVHRFYQLSKTKLGLSIGEGHEVVGERCGGGEDQKERLRQAKGPVQLEFESTSAFTTSLQ